MKDQEKLNKLTNLLSEMKKLAKEYNELALDCNMATIDSFQFDYDEWCDSDWSSSDADC